GSSSRRDRPASTREPRTIAWDHRAAAVLTAASVILFAACNVFLLDNHPAVMIKNQTDHAVDVVIVPDAGGPETIVATGLEAGRDYPYDRLSSAPCSPSLLLARE